MLGVEAVGALAALGFERLDGVASLLHRASHEAADCVALPAHFFHNLGERGAVLALQHRHHLGRLGAAAYPLGLLCTRGRCLGFGRFLRGRGLLLALPLAGAPWAAGAPPLAFLWAFGLEGSATGWAVSPSPWMLSQILPAPAAAVRNFFTGSAPGTLL
jgi:hypothetical protein